jgi:hypothetical protein
VVHDPRRARAVVEAAVRSAAEVKNDPPDLINVALEMLVKASLELPAFSTANEIASRVRREVNTGMFERIDGRIGLPDRLSLESLLDAVGPAVKTPFNRLKQPAGKASWAGRRTQPKCTRLRHERCPGSVTPVRSVLDRHEELRALAWTASGRLTNQG